MSALDGAASFGAAEGDEYEPDSDDDVDLADLEDELLKDEVAAEAGVEKEEVDELQESKRLKR